MKIPKNETELIILFAESEKEEFEIISFSPSSFPDAMVMNKISGEILRVEFEYNAKSFIEHGHNPSDCDMIICWTNDFPFETDFPIWEISTNKKPKTCKTLNNTNEILSYVLEYLQRRDKKRIKRLETSMSQTVKMTGKTRHWRNIKNLLTREDLEQLANLTPSQIREMAQKEGLTSRTISNWKNNARNELGL